IKSEALQNVERLAMGLPLPDGEGWGEGEATAQPLAPAQKRIRVPTTNIKGLTIRTKETILRERARAEFSALQDFLRRVQPLNEEMDSLIKAGAFDEFGKPRTTQYWEFKGS